MTYHHEKEVIWVLFTCHSFIVK